MSEVKILLVDDEETLLEISKVYIEKLDESFRIHTVKSAKEAIKLLKKTPFDVIISDYQMPEIDGLKFLSILREQDYDIPFIIFTGKGREEVAIQALNLGADYYLQKGGETETQFHELANLIRKLVEQKQAEKARLHLLNQQISINRLAVTLGESRDLNKIYKTIFKHIYSIMDADTFVVSFFDSKTNIISPGYALINRKVIDITVFPALPLEHPENEIRKKVIETNNYVYLENLRRNESDQGKIAATGEAEYTKSAVFVPMKIGGETIGIIEVHSYRANAYSEQDIELLSALANVAAVAIQNARLFNMQQDINEQLRQEKERTQAVLDLIEALVLVLDKNGIVQRINRKGCEILGYTEEEIMGKNWIETFLPEEYREKVKQRIKKIIETGEILSVNINPIITKDGSEVMISWKTSILPEQIDGVECVLSTGVEITDELVKETERLQEEEHYKYLTKMSDEGLIILQDNEIKFMNNNMRKILGLGKKELIDFDPEPFLRGKDKERFIDLLTTYEETGHLPKEFQCWIFSKNNVKKYIQNSIISVKTPDGSNRYYILVKDITEKKLAEIALESSERKLRTTLNAFPYPMHVVNRNLKFIIFNQAMMEWLENLNLDITLDGKTVYEAFPFLPQEVIDEYQYVFETGKTVYKKDCTVLNGREIFTETRKFPVIEKDKVISVITIIRDVTKEIQIEQQLRKNEETLRLLFESSSDGILILDQDDNILNANKKAMEFLGDVKENLVKANFKNFLDKKQRKIFTEYKKALETKKESKLELKLKTKNNKLMITEISAGYTEIGKEKLLQLIIRDIQERKIAEENRQRYINDLQFLSKTAMGFIGHLTEEDLFKYVGDKITSIVKDATVMLFASDGDSNEVTVKYLAGLGSQRKLLQNAFAHEIIGMKIKLTPKMLALLNKQELCEIEDDYTELVKDSFPKKVIEGILKKLKIEHIYFRHFNSKETTFAGINIFMHNKRKLKSYELIEAFLSQASIAFEKHFTRKKLLLSEEQFQQLIETMSDGLAIDDHDGRFIYVNPRFCEMLGFRSEEIIGKKVIEFVAKKDVSKYINLSRKRLANEASSKSYEITWITKSGKELPTIVSPKMMNDTTGEIIGSFAVITDITKLKRYEGKLKEQQKLLQQQRDELESFASTIAHDLRGKMQVISLYNSLAKHEYSDKITESIEEMTTFIEDLLFLAKKGQILGKVTKVNLEQLIQRTKAKIAKLDPKLKIECEQLPTVLADKIRLKQVFENLLMNVIKHAKATHLKIYTKEDKKFHYIIIEDNGKGISEKTKKAIIESWKTNRYSSFGLLIVYKIIKAHGGKLILESKEGKGTKVTFSLPKKK
ncbi:MAG: PAS domain S-box protein [Candidatus Heimdallarchaeota archaeon]|nr:PAS domain S-box protein [Candidatus Heimdallarchaeota archaeon]